MDKRYIDWYKLKSKLHARTEIPDGYKERHVWWLSLGSNVGDEEDGKGVLFRRPVLIVHGFNKHLFWGIPLSTKIKSGKYYYSFHIDGKPSAAIVSQLRVFDTKRLIRKYGIINENDFNNIKSKIIELLS